MSRLDITIPQVLQSLPDVWIVWCNEQVEAKDGTTKRTKVPYQGRTPALKASCTNPLTWCSLNDAQAAYVNVERVDGLGFCIIKTECVAFDIDDCRDPESGALHDWAQKLVERCQSYTEITPSGAGLRIIGTGTGEKLHRKLPVADGVSCEVYRKAERFIAVTGHQLALELNELKDLDTIANEVVAELEGAKQQAEQAKQEKMKFDVGGGKKKELPPLDDIIKRGCFEHWGGDRSRAEWHVIHALIGNAKTDSEIAAVFMDLNNEIASHCQSRKEKPADYIARVITRARAEAETPSPAGDSSPDGVEIARLAALSDIEYERQRKAAAERLGISRVSILDRSVQTERDKKKPASDDKLQGHELKFDDPEPWTEEVNGVELLDALESIINEHVIFTSEHQARLVALWIVYTYLVDCFRFSPRLGVTSPTRGCGKSTLLDLVRLLSFRGISTANITSAAVFRMIDKYHPTLIIDEADTFLGDYGDLQGILNSGHKKGDFAIRLAGDDHDIRGFDIFGSVAIGMIGVLPNQLIERAIRIVMQRRRKTDKEPKQLDGETALEPFRVLQRKIARWAGDHKVEIGNTKADVPSEVYNRVRDNWRVLKRIATVVGGKWPDYVDAAAREAVKSEDISDNDLLTLLLSDIRDIKFRYTIILNKGTRDERVEYDKEGEIRSEALLDKLKGLQGRPWAEMPGRDGKPLTANKLASLLKPLGVIPELIGPRRLSGYRREHFADAFERYLSEEGKPKEGEKEEGTPNPKEGESNLSSSLTPIKPGTSEIFKPLMPENQREVQKCKKPNNDGQKRGREVWNGGSRAEEPLKPPKPANGEDKGLDAQTIRRLAVEYQTRFYEEKDEQALDVWLRKELAEQGVFAEFIGIEFSRVKDALFALSAGDR
jgi:hypothetical protein